MSDGHDPSVYNKLIIFNDDLAIHTLYIYIHNQIDDIQYTYLNYILYKFPTVWRLSYKSYLTEIHQSVRNIHSDIYNERHQCGW